MAYAFASASSQYFSVSPIPSATLPLTVFASVYPQNDTATNAFASYTNSATNDAILNLALFGSVAGDPVAASMRTAGTGTVTALTTAAPTQNAWNTAAGVFTALNSRTAYVNGGNSATVTTNMNAFSLDRFSIGALVRSTVGDLMNGRLAEVAVWSISLTANDVASLAKGFKPTRVRPQSLIFYAPMIRTAQDVRGGRTLTAVNGPTVIDHPRVY